jgi:hypothetical protein
MNDRLRREPIVARHSGKRAAVRAEQLREERRRADRARAQRLRGQVLVNSTNLRPTNSYDTPDFVVRGFYVDRPFDCKTCGVAQVWTATQQKWWYEAAKGDVWTVAVLCKPCRRREQARKAAARIMQLEGLARKAAQRA